MNASTQVLDLSSDVGELPGADGAAIDAAILECVTSANVACGGHVGDAESMARVCDQAAERLVTIGAQVSYLDREGFGRRRLEVPFDTLVAQLEEQLGHLQTAAGTAGSAVSYMRPHGALYNAALVDEVVAHAVVTATPPGMPVLCIGGSELARAAERAGLTVVPEIFSDRAVTRRGLLVDRAVPGAVITDPAAVVARLTSWVESGELPSIDGSPVRIEARSVCTHSDTRGATEILRALRRRLERVGARFEPFTSAGHG